MMSKRTFTIALLAGVLGLSGPAHAQSTDGVIDLAQNSCFARGQAVANQQGATLVSAEPAQQNGRQVCRVVLLIEGQGGERPRREVVFVDP